MGRYEAAPSSKISRFTHGRKAHNKGAGVTRTLGYATGDGAAEAALDCRRVARGGFNLVLIHKLIEALQVHTQVDRISGTESMIDMQSQARVWRRPECVPLQKYGIGLRVLLTDHKFFPVGVVRVFFEARRRFPMSAVNTTALRPRSHNARTAGERKQYRDAWRGAVAGSDLPKMDGGLK